MKLKKKRIIIDTSIINIDKNQNKTDITFVFDKQIKNVKSINLIYLSFPLNYYNISSKRKNNQLIFREYIFNSHITNIRFKDKSDDINYKDTDKKQLVITVEKWNRTFFNIDSTITDMSLREPLVTSKPSLTITNSSLFITNNELTNFYQTFSDFRRFSETHRTMKWSFDDYLPKITDISSYGIVWNGVYKITDNDLDMLDSNYTSKFKEYWNTDISGYNTKFILTPERSIDFVTSYNGNINTIDSSGLYNLFIDKLPKLYQDSKGDRLSNTLISVYKDHIITIPDGNYSIDLLLNKITQEYELEQKKFNEYIDNLYTKFDDRDFNTDGILYKFRGKEKINLKFREKYPLEYLSCWNNRRSWYVKLYNESSTKIIDSKNRGIIKDYFTNNINFVFNTPYRNQTSVWEEDINYTLPWYERMFGLLKSGGNNDYDLLYYLGFTSFNRPLIKNIKNNLREDKIYYPQFVDLNNISQDYLQNGNYGNYDFNFKRDSVINSSDHYTFATIKDYKSIITNFKTYLNKDGDNGITIPKEVSLSNTLTTNLLLDEKYNKFPDFWKETPYSMPTKDISKKYMIVQSDNNSNLASDNYIFLQINDYSVYESIIDKKFKIPMGGNNFRYYNTEKIMKKPIFYKFMTKTNDYKNEQIEIERHDSIQKYEFDNIRNIDKLKINFFDRFGKTIDIGNSNYILIFEFEILVPDF